MKLVYSRRALSDLTDIASYDTTTASPAVAEAIERRFVDVIERIRTAPLSAPRVAQRSQVRAVAVVRYPFRIFYRVRGDTIDILHIRHTSRRAAHRSQRSWSQLFEVIGVPQVFCRSPLRNGGDTYSLKTAANGQNHCPFIEESIIFLI